MENGGAGESCNLQQQGQKKTAGGVAGVQLGATQDLQEATYLLHPPAHRPSTSQERKQRARSMQSGWTAPVVAGAAGVTAMRKSQLKLPELRRREQHQMAVLSSSGTVRHTRAGAHERAQVDHLNLSTVATEDTISGWRQSPLPSHSETGPTIDQEHAAEHEARLKTQRFYSDERPRLVSPPRQSRVAVVANGQGHEYVTNSIQSPRGTKQKSKKSSHQADRPWAVQRVNAARPAPDFDLPSSGLQGLLLQAEATAVAASEVGEYVRYADSATREVPASCSDQSGLQSPRKASVAPFGSSLSTWG